MKSFLTQRQVLALFLASFFPLLTMASFEDIAASAYSSSLPRYEHSSSLPLFPTLTSSPNQEIERRIILNKLRSTRWGPGSTPIVTSWSPPSALTEEELTLHESSFEKSTGWEQSDVSENLYSSVQSFWSMPFLLSSTDFLEILLKAVCPVVMFSEPYTQLRSLSRLSVSK